MSEDRRKRDGLFKVIFFLLAIIQTIALGWFYKIDSKAEKIPVLEANIRAIQDDVSYIRSRIDSITTEWGK